MVLPLRFAISRRAVVVVASLLVLGATTLIATTLAATTPAATTFAPTTLAATTLVGATPQRANDGNGANGGDGTIYIAGYDEAIHILDEATMDEVGKIATTAGSPQDLLLSHDRRRFYTLSIDFERIEVFDIMDPAFRVSKADPHLNRAGNAEVTDFIVQGLSYRTACLPPGE